MPSLPSLLTRLPSTFYPEWKQSKALTRSRCLIMNFPTIRIVSQINHYIYVYILPSLRYYIIVTQNGLRHSSFLSKEPVFSNLPMPTVSFSPVYRLPGPCSHLNWWDHAPTVAPKGPLHRALGLSSFWCHSLLQPGTVILSVCPSCTMLP